MSRVRVPLSAPMKQFVLPIVLNQTEARNACREILYRNNIGDRLKGYDDKFLRELIQYHPNKDEKSGDGISYFFVAVDDTYKTRQFRFIRVDGSECVFSFYKCLGIIKK